MGLRLTFGEISQNVEMYCNNSPEPPFLDIEGVKIAAHM